MNKQRHPTLADVARQAGVSRSLVSLAIRGEGNVRPETRERIVHAAHELNYRPNIAARVLASAQSAYVGTLVGDITNPLQAEIAKWVQRHRRRARLQRPGVARRRQRRKGRERHRDPDRSSRLRASSSLAHPTKSRPSPASSGPLPSIYIGRLLKAVEVDSVTTDHIKGAALAVEHLVSAVGCRSIVHVGGGASPGAQRMQQGYRETMERHGIGGLVEVIDAGYSIDAGAQAGRPDLCADGPCRTASSPATT